MLSARVRGDTDRQKDRGRPKEVANRAWTVRSVCA